MAIWMIAIGADIRMGDVGSHVWSSVAHTKRIRIRHSVRKSSALHRGNDPHRRNLPFRPASNLSLQLGHFQLHSKSWPLPIPLGTAMSLRREQLLECAWL